MGARASTHTAAAGAWGWSRKRGDWALSSPALTTLSSSIKRVRGVVRRDAPMQDFVAYEELIKLRLEDGIDPTRKEDYLTEEEFEKVRSNSGMPAARAAGWLLRRRGVRA